MFPFMISIINEIEIKWIIQKNALSANFEGEMGKFQQTF